MAADLLGEEEVPQCPICSSVTDFPRGPPNRQPTFGDFGLGFFSVLTPPLSLYT